MVSHLVLIITLHRSFINPKMIDEMSDENSILV